MGPLGWRSSPFSIAAKHERDYVECVFTRGWPGWVVLSGWLNIKMAQTLLEPANMGGFRGGGKGAMPPHKMPSHHCNQLANAITIH